MYFLNAMENSNRTVIPGSDILVWLKMNSTKTNPPTISLRASISLQKLFLQSLLQELFESENSVQHEEYECKRSKNTENKLD